MKRFLPFVFASVISVSLISARQAIFASPAPMVTLHQSDARLLAIETELARLINQERAKRDLPLLTYDVKLSDVARAHSAEMRDEKYFSHESPTSLLQWPINRFQKGMQQTPRFVAENIYHRWGGSPGLSSDSAMQAHQSLMNSPGHKANILLSSVTRLGIGITADAKGDIWVTEMFSRLR